MTYWKCNSLQLFSAQSMQMSMWSCGIAHFYILFNMSSFFPCLLHCVYAYVCISVSLSFISPSLWKFFIWLVLPSQASGFPLLVPYILDSSFNSLFSFNFEKEWESYLYTVLYLTSSVTTANSETSCISIFSLVKENKSLPSLRSFEKEWVGWQQQC